MGISTYRFSVLPRKTITSCNTLRSKAVEGPVSAWHKYEATWSLHAYSLCQPEKYLLLNEQVDWVLVLYWFLSSTYKDTELYYWWDLFLLCSWQTHRYSYDCHALSNSPEMQTSSPCLLWGLQLRLDPKSNRESQSVRGRREVVSVLWCVVGQGGARGGALGGQHKGNLCSGTAHWTGGCCSASPRSH